MTIYLQSPVVYLMNHQAEHTAFVSHTVLLRSGLLLEHTATISVQSINWGDATCSRFRLTPRITTSLRPLWVTDESEVFSATPVRRESGSNDIANSVQTTYPALAADRILRTAPKHQSNLSVTKISIWNSGRAPSPFCCMPGQLLITANTITAVRS
jgi:hypothetical protein